MAKNKLTQTDIAKMVSDVFNISYNVSTHLTSIEAECVTLRTIFLNDKGTPKLPYVVAKQLEDTIVLARVCQALFKTSQRKLSLQDAIVLKNTKEKTPQEVAAFRAGRDHKSWLLNKAKIPTCESRGGNNNKTGKTGKPKGSTNEVKTVAFTAKAGESLTPKVMSAEDLKKFVRGEAARLLAFHEKNKDVKCDEAHQAILTFYRTASLIK